MLDIGSGNGGAAIGIGQNQRFEVTAIDIITNQDLLALRRQLSLPVHQITGVGEALPFHNSAFDIILCLDTIEHVPDPGGLATEIIRVLKPGGICMITTPARLRHLFGPDPHYGINYILLLPDKIQGLVATKILRRVEHYEVEHIFWHVAGITRLFPQPYAVEVLWNRPRPYRSKLGNTAWWYLRHMLWDRILIQKKE